MQDETKIFVEMTKTQYEEIKKALSDIKTKHAENLADVSDRFICSRCGIHLEDCTRFVYDEDSDDTSHYEYEFKFCPECGAEVRGRGHDIG